MLQGSTAQMSVAFSAKIHLDISKRSPKCQSLGIGGD